MNNLLTLEVTGNSMEPSVKNGDIVYVNPDIMPAANGKDMAVFIVNDEKLHICCYTRHGSQLILLHENGRHGVVRDYQVEIMGKVVEIEKNHIAGNDMALV